MATYSSREVARMLGLAETQVRSFVRDGFLEPERDVEGNPRFGFQDLVVLRTAKRLLDQQVPTRRVRRALGALRARLPRGTPLAGVHLAMDGEELVVSDPSGRWAPESGQAMFEFEAPRVAVIEAIESANGFGPPPFEDDEDLAPVTMLRAPPSTDEPDSESADKMGCADWLDLADAYESQGRSLPARDALRRALEVDPFESEARVRLARQLELDGRLEASERHLELARRLRPRDPDIAVDHGRVLMQVGKLRPALAAFEAAIAEDPELSEAYLGAADAHERLGDHEACREVLRASEHLRKD